MLIFESLFQRKGTAEKLYEAKIICNSKEKDHYLYYFLKCHPGRTLVTFQLVSIHLDNLFNVACM